MPTSAVPISAIPTGAVPTSAGPVEPRRSRRVTVVAVLAVVFLLAFVGNGVAVLAVQARLNNEKAKLSTELAARQHAEAAARADLETRFKQADLPRKLQTVRDRDRAASDALIAWGTSSQPLSGLKTIRQARNSCQAAVIDYDATAAQFPDDLLVGLPNRINLNDESTNCGR
ncbi:hypothetical protein [Dactylosporangium matsuzakiense]|nr:hypothetical protein [Dactylosporangium matsuzakiense]UWZ42203.1 hypothetical protein Dmats_32085 [Dactylosporangium matsuzakiense]